MTLQSAAQALIDSIDLDEKSGLLSQKTIRLNDELRQALLQQKAAAKPAPSEAQQQAALDEIRAWFAKQALAIRDAETSEQAEQILIDTAFDVAGIRNEDTHHG